MAARTRLHQLAAILADADKQGSMIVAHRIQQAIREREVLDFDGQALTVTIGVSSLHPTASHFASSLLMKADDALDLARERGAGQIASA